MHTSLFTIGFAKKSAETFFNRLQKEKIKKIIDIRLHNSSQLAGFAKKDDLQYFLKSICDIDYVHLPLLAPTQEIFDEYKKGGNDWHRYADRFNEVLRQRKIENILSRGELDRSCLLCSEDSAQNCHRRLVAEYLNETLGDIKIVHL